MAAARPTQVSEWRKHLPPPFDKPAPLLSRRKSTSHPPLGEDEPHKHCVNSCTRRGSATGALQRSDRGLYWAQNLKKYDSHRDRNQDVNSVVQKLKSALHTSHAQGSLRLSKDGNSSTDGSCNSGAESEKLDASKTAPPTIDDVALLASTCFPNIEESQVYITEYSSHIHRVSRYTLEEVLASDTLLGPPSPVTAVRWIHVDYHHIGTFWGSGVRFEQWGADPALFEKSPVQLVHQRSAELDRAAERPTADETGLTGYKRIGEYHRQHPGSPEWIGIRRRASWLREDRYCTLLRYLEENPEIANHLRSREDNDLEYAISYLQARRLLQSHDAPVASWSPEVQKMLGNGKISFSGPWDDQVERFEFHHKHTLISSGSPKLYQTAAERLRSPLDTLRLFPYTVYLYYTLLRLPVQNDEMVQDKPERDLNLLFNHLKSRNGVDRRQVEQVVNLQQKLLAGMDYLSENLREHVLWGVLPFKGQPFQFHPSHTPPPQIEELITAEQELIERDLHMALEWWKSLKTKFRALEQQELAAKQSKLASERQHLAVIEAQQARIQSRSVIIFTFITIIFLPMSFFTSYFGMNFADLDQRQTGGRDSSYFWAVSIPVSMVILVLVGLAIRAMPVRSAQEVASDLECDLDSSVFRLCGVEAVASGTVCEKGKKSLNIPTTHRWTVTP
ncbi:MAG: hypothetical protein M1831_005429 [Alyxoria varia]|nr:MAG: hypothetical protein M1831_005429 [Alyxoria varia]